MTGTYHPDNEVLDYPKDIYGFDDKRRTSTPEYRLGTTGVGRFGTLWVYGVAGEAINAASAVTFDLQTSEITDANGSYTAMANFADGQYGWIKRTASEVTDDVA